MVHDSTRFRPQRSAARTSAYAIIVPAFTTVTSRPPSVGDSSNVLRMLGSSCASARKSYPSKNDATDRNTSKRRW
jgi:hypothetical protein